MQTKIQRRLAADRRNTEDLQGVYSIIEEWAGKEGDDACWYYPELFNRLAEHLEIELPRATIERKKFRKGCERFEGELYEGKGRGGK